MGCKSEHQDSLTISILTTSLQADYLPGLKLEFKDAFALEKTRFCLHLVQISKEP